MGKHQIEQQKRARRRIAITVLLFALLGVMIFVGYYLLKSAVRSVSQASNAVYQRTSEKVIKETEDSYYQMAFTKALIPTLEKDFLALKPLYTALQGIIKENE